ncbi:MAG: glycosyltransferase [Chloroflexi bacterium]|nr:glycosyltransferase [Chloroflexota bacterium]
MHKILYVIRPVAGGMREHLALLVKHLDRDAFETQAVIPDDALLGERLRKSGCEKVWVCGDVGSIRPLSVFRSARMVRRLAKRIGVGLVHTHGYRTALGAGLGARLAGVPHVVTIHTELGSQKDPGVFGRFAQSVVSVLSDRVIVVTEAIMGSFAERKVRLVENGVELGSFNPARSNEPRNVGFIGRLAPEKGADLFLEAAALLSKRVAGVHFVIVGEGSLREELGRKAEGLGIANVTEFTGFIDGARRVMESLDVLVLPSRSEAQPMVLLEALADGLPVVATDVGGVRRLLDGCGVIVPPGDVEAIASEVERLLSSAGEAGLMAMKGRKRIEERYSAEMMVQNTSAIYREVLGGV